MSKFLTACMSVFAVASTLALQADDTEKKSAVYHAVIAQDEPTTPKMISDTEETTGDVEIQPYPRMCSDDTFGDDDEDDLKSAILA